MISESEKDDAPQQPEGTMQSGRRALRISEGERTEFTKMVPVERRAVITLNGKRLAGMLYSGCCLRELAYGFLYNEEVISSVEDIEGCIIDGDNAAVTLRADVQERERDTFLSSGLGGCTLSADSFDVPLCDSSRYQPESVPVYMGEMDRSARAYAAGGGIHCSALFRESQMIASFEDIGRHNTLDKLCGHCLLGGISLDGLLLTTTGRVSEEMLRKALRMGVVAVASLSGATDVAVDLANRSNLLLMGYVKDGCVTVY